MLRTQDVLEYKIRTSSSGSTDSNASYLKTLITQSSPPHTSPTTSPPSSSNNNAVVVPSSFASYLWKRDPKGIVKMWKKRYFLVKVRVAISISTRLYLYLSLTQTITYWFDLISSTDIYIYIRVCDCITRSLQTILQWERQ